MPYKHHENRRHKFAKPKYKVTNWPEYNQALRRRGDITIWFTDEAITGWRPARTGTRGRPQEYSDVAIETAVFIRQVFHLPLRQTEGFMSSLALILKADIRIPDFSCISKRSIALPRHALSRAVEPGSLVIVDSTGLKERAPFRGLAVLIIDFDRLLRKIGARWQTQPMSRFSVFTSGFARSVR